LVTLDFNAVGKRIGPHTLKYGWKDVVLYSLGVGAGFSEISYCYEKTLKVIPTFAAVSLGDFTSQLAALSCFNLTGVLHGEQEWVFHRPIPLQGTMITEGAIKHYYDKGKEKGALVVAEFDTRQPDGKKLFTSVVTMFARRDGGFGGPDAPRKSLKFPERAADFEAEALPSSDQPLIYRLSGDTFPLHVDAKIASSAGFDRPIMHGLCTLGYACRALIRHLTPGAPERVRRIGCRFTKPLYPGAPIKTLIWTTEQGKALWRVVKDPGGEAVIDKGFIECSDFSVD
jgi:acyl dehydratase